MFAKLKAKPGILELERDFNMQTMRLGDLELQIFRLNKAKSQCLQLLENLNKEGIALKKKLGEAEVNRIVQEASDKPKEKQSDLN